MMKRFLSIILAIAMVLAMLPSVVFAEEKEITTLEYLINTNVISDENLKGTQLGISSPDGLLGKITSYDQLDSTTQPWLLKNFYKSAAANITFERLLFAATQSNIQNKNAWLVFKIQIPKGIYKFDINAADYLYGAGIDVYLFPSNGVNSAGPNQFNELDPIGHIDTYADGSKGNVFVDKTIATVNIDKDDEYFIVLRLADGGHYNADNNREMIYIAKFVFRETPVSSIIFNKESLEVEVNNKTSVVAIPKDVNGNTIDVATITYMSENPAIATVDEVTGEVTGISDGRTNIIAKVSECNVTAKIPIVVKDYTHNYIFSTGVFTEETVTAITVEESDKYNGLYSGVLRKLSLVADDFKYVDSTKSDLWAWSSLGSSSGNLAATQFNLSVLLSSIGHDAPASRFVIKLKVKYPGVYDLGIESNKHATAALSADVYMLKADGISDLSNAVIRSNKKIGTIDGTIGSSANDVLGAVELDSGDYFLVFDFWNKLAAAGAKHNFYPKSAKLTLHEGDLVEEDTAVKLENKKLSFAVGSTDKVEIAVNGNVYSENSIYEFERAKKITVKVGNAPAGKRFKAWVQGTADNGIWKSDDEEYSFDIMTHTYLTAVYEDIPAEDSYVIEYYNENGKYYATEKANGTTPVLPENPTLTGYTFDMWTLDGETKFDESSPLAEKLTRAVAKYSANAITTNHSVKYNGQTITDPFGTKIAVSDPKATHWLRDGRIVAYGTEYTHYIWDGTSIYPSYAEVEKNPVVVIEDTLVDGANMIEYDAGNKNIVEVGILFGTATVDVSSCRYKATSQWNKSHGQFTASRNSDEAYARGYLIYDDGGTYKVIYTEAIAVK